MTSSAALPHVALIATGGTIAGAAPSGTSGGYQAGVYGVDALLQAVPDLARIARVTGEQLLQIDSKDFDDSRLLLLARRADTLLRQPDVDAVVITHGTDTLEESAYFLNLVLRHSKPVVLVGAMRPATALSADGPLNLFQAVQVATSPASGAQGVLVVMNGAIFAARDAAKQDSVAVQAFGSPYGPLGWATADGPRYYRTASRPHTVNSRFDIASLEKLPRVDVVTTHGNVSATAYEALAAAGARGLVHAGFGGGSVPDVLRPTFARLRAQGVAIVRASRVGQGPLLRGADPDDEALGLLVVDDQSAVKARLLLALGLTQTDQTAALQTLFDTY